MIEPLKDENGVALLMVLWVMVLLLVIVFEFSFISRSDLDMTANFKDSTRAYYLALAGIDTAIREIIQPSNFQYIGENGELLFGETITLGEGAADIMNENDEFARNDIPLGAGRFTYDIIDEDSKININTIDQKALTKLLELLGIDMGVHQTEIVNSILDWKDRDEIHRPNGAEDDYYNSLPDPYDCKDGKFDTIEELLLVKGITPELFYGSGLPGGPVTVMGDTIPGLRDLLTTYGHQINRNTAPEEVLYATLSDGEAYRIINDREMSPRHGRQGQSRYYTITSRGIVAPSGVSQTIKATISKLGATIRINCWNDNYFELY